MREITLTRDWGRYPKGMSLRVWEPGAALGRGVVDPKRAAQLVADGYVAAAAPKGAPAASAEPPSAAHEKPAPKSAPKG